MRAAIRARLLAQVPSITEGWFQPFEAGADQEKPYGVVKIGTKTGSGVNTLGKFTAVEVWPYFDREDSDYDEVDAAVIEIIQALRNVTLTSTAGNLFTLEYTGEGIDYEDDALDALTRAVYFRIPGLM